MADLPDWLLALLQGQQPQSAGPIAPAGGPPSMSYMAPSPPWAPQGLLAQGPSDAPPAFTYVNPGSPALGGSPEPLDTSYGAPGQPYRLPGSPPTWAGQLASMPNVGSAAGSADIPLPPRRPGDLSGFRATVDTPQVASEGDVPDTPTPAQPLNLGQAAAPTSNVYGTPASGAPGTPSPFGGVGNVLGKVGDAIGGIYGAGGPGDALIALGLSNRTGGKSIEALNAAGNQRLNQAKIAAFNLQVANQQNSLNATRNWLLGQTDKKTGEPALKPSDVDSALARAAAGDTTQLNEYTKQFAAGDKYQFREFGGKLIGTNAYEPTDIKVVADLGNQRFMTPEEKVAANIDPNDGRNWIRDKEGKPQPVGDQSVAAKVLEKSDLQGITELPQTKVQAQSAIDLKSAISRARTALDKGAIVGPSANLDLNARKIWSGIMGIDDKAVTNTQEFQAAVATKTAALARQLATSGHTTNADILQGQLQSGGDITNNKDAIKAIFDGQEQLANDVIKRHQKSVDVLAKKYPQAGLSDQYGVDEPPQAQPQTAGRRGVFDPNLGRVVWQ